MGTGTVIDWPLWPAPSYKGEGFVYKGDGFSWPFV